MTASDRCASRHRDRRGGHVAGWSVTLCGIEENSIEGEFAVVAALVSGYPWVLLVVGLIGLWMGIDRTFNAKKNESDLLRLLALVGGLVMLALPIAMVVQGSDGEAIAPITLILMLLLGLSLCARAMKRVPMTFLIVAASGLGLFLLAMQLGDVPIVGKVPMSIVAVVMLLILGGVFAATFAVESALDVFLGILGWGPLVAAIAILAAGQGAVIAFGVTGAAGLAEYLG